MLRHAELLRIIKKYRKGLPIMNKHDKMMKNER